MTTREVNAERADHCCGALSTQLRLGQKFVGERRRSRFAELRFAELDGAAAAQVVIFLLSIRGNFTLDTVIYVLYIFSVEWRLP